MRISVLVVSYNVRTLLARCLASLRGAYEVIVVDNASSDGTPEMVRAEFPHVTLIALSDNRGFSVAVNLAAHQATGDVFFLLNPDAELPLDGIAKIEQSLEACPNAAAMGFRQVDDAGHFQLAMGFSPTFLNEGMRFLVQHGLNAGILKIGTYIDAWLKTSREVPWVAGSSLLVRRQAFERIQGFDESFFLYFEDIDFCLRLKQSGGAVYYDPSVTLVHHRGQSASQSESIAKRAYRDSQRYFWRKHRGAMVEKMVAAYQRLRVLVE